MKICPHHSNQLKNSLFSAGLDPRANPDACFLCEELILANAITRDAAIAFSPPTICPLCELPIAEALSWMKQAGQSIAKERKRS